MATKHCFLLFAAGTLRPPLYVALLVQASRRCASPLRLPLYIVVLVQASRHCPARIDTCLHPRLVAGRLGEEAGHCQTCRGRASAAGRQSERCQDMRHMLLDCRYLVQASGVWRANQAGFCTSAVLRHPVMQERTGKPPAPDALDGCKASCCTHVGCLTCWLLHDPWSAPLTTQAGDCFPHMRSSCSLYNRPCLPSPAGPTTKLRSQPQW